MDLFIFYLGGNAERSNIEVHDVQFAVAAAPEEAWPLLREAWFGYKDQVHIDGYARLRWADGYSISVSREPQESAQHLFFVNAGAYRTGTLQELHEFGFFVAEDAATAKKKALAVLLTNHNHQHKDDLKDVDDFLLLDKVGDFHIHLTPKAEGAAFAPEWQGYQPIGI